MNNNHLHHPTFVDCHVSTEFYELLSESDASVIPVANKQDGIVENDDGDKESIESSSSRETSSSEEEHSSSEEEYVDDGSQNEEAETFSKSKFSLKNLIVIALIAFISDLV